MDDPAASGEHLAASRVLISLADAFHLWRHHLVTRNPLIRAIDRRELLARVAIMAATLALLPIPVAIGSMQHDAGMATITRQRAERHPVPAMVVATPRDGDATVAAAWTGTYGRHLGRISAQDTDGRGTVRTIWIDRSDRPTERPRSPGTAVGQGILAGSVALVLLGLLAALALHIVTVAADRGRYRAWDREWQAFRLMP
ncbi:MAG: hypothetical protein INR72_09970 [Williamsia herbipolensis]|nr:hypothetical protein [Williamsia herbipolensis]